MGGKHRTSQRTKNNARPSSSGRSAEMLGTSMPYFVGTPGPKDANIVLPSFSQSGFKGLESTMDANFQVVFKKFSKKDTTTKLKALQEFTELTKNSEPEMIKSILEYWTHTYSILISDIDHRVREAAHTAHFDVAVKMKKKLAPYLKQLIGPWFISQYDTYAPAASAAKNAFEALFPPNKLEDVILYYQVDILSFVLDTLNGQNQKTFGNANAKQMTDEESQDKYERVVLSNLSAYSFYLRTIPLEHIKKAEELNTKIISDPKFWELQKCKSPVLKAAFFGVLSAIGQNAPFLYETNKRKIISTVFNNLDQTEPITLKNIWESAVLIITNVEMWWQHINVEKMLVPKLLKILNEAAWGNATIIYPYLLLLISNLPPTLNTETFYFKFFENMQVGFQQKALLNTKSEATAIMTAYMECLKYIMVQNQTNASLCEKLINAHICGLLKWSMLCKKTVYKTVLSEIVTFIQYWYKNKTENSKVQTETFWKNTEITFEDLLFSSEIENDIDRLLETASKQAEFLKRLSTVEKEKKSSRVNFSSEDEVSPDKNDIQEKPSVAAQIGDDYTQSLHTLAIKTCKYFLELINRKKSKRFIEHMYNVLKAFDDDLFFKNWCQQMCEGFEKRDWMEFYRRVVYEWLKNESLRCNAAVGTIFLYFKYLQTAEKQDILKSIANLNNQDCMEWSITNALQYPNSEDIVCQNWLHSEPVSKFISQLAQNEFSSESSPQLNPLLMEIFAERKDGQLFINSTTVTDVTDKIRQSLTNPSEEFDIEKCARFAAHLSSILYSEKYGFTHGDKLLLALVDLSTNTNVVDEILSESAVSEITFAWQGAVSNVLPKVSEERALALVADVFTIALDKAALLYEFDLHKIEILTRFVVDFVRCSQKCVPWLTDAFVRLFFKQNVLLGYGNCLRDLNMCAECIKGALSSPYKSITVPEPTDDRKFFNYFIWFYLKCDIVSAPLDEDTDECENLLNFCDDKSELFADLIYDLSLGLLHCENYTMMKFTELIHEVCTAAECKIKSIFPLLTNDTTKSLTERFARNIRKEDWLWCKSAHTFCTRIAPTYLTNISDAVNELVTPVESKVAHLYAKQIFRQENYVESSDFDVLGNVISLASSLRKKGVLTEETLRQVELLWHASKDLSKNLGLRVDFDDVKSNDLHYMIEFLNLYSLIVQLKTEFEPLNRWEIEIFSLINVVSSDTLKERLGKVEVDVRALALIAAVGSLFNSLDEFRNKFSGDIPTDEILIYNKDREIFTICQILSETYSTTNELHPVHLPFVQTFRMALRNLHYPTVSAVPEKSPNCFQILKCSSALLTHPVVSLQLWGYQMLLALAPKLLQVDALAVTHNSPHGKGLVLQHLRETLVHTQGIVQAVLSDFKLGEDTCRVQPFTDSFTYTLAYLLLWNVLLNLCKKASTELRYQYAEWLQQDDFFKILMTHLFRLMPTEIIHSNELKLKMPNKFVVPPPLDKCDPCTSENLEQIVCWVYASSVFQLPVLVRQWWINTDARLSHLVDHVTSTFISPTLCNQELTAIAQHETKFKNMVVKVHQSVREVVAIYSVDDAHVELIITLPANYPLGVPDIQCGSHIGGTSHRQWLMQLKMCILHQNGRIWDGLSLWNSNLDKKFDGVEECYICFAVLHPGTYQLPKLSCQTCKKKFHSPCLYKWFSTSNKSTCPICRNLF